VPRQSTYLPGGTRAHLVLHPGSSEVTLEEEKVTVTGMGVKDCDLTVDLNLDHKVLWINGITTVVA
jgi:hypothetical protein